MPRALFICCKRPYVIHNDLSAFYRPDHYFNFIPRSTDMMWVILASHSRTLCGNAIPIELPKQSMSEPRT
ncbi:hypothetical protein QVD17_26991 [Tagetes erecta]|uniref:Uncharacterized protein n=1 Tax=Tagetes erecta TaxID=13708 RepID=A0AAD8NQU3_TARER|nr:hypothetical protein QVD17_26991 [Tagetes erecta]